MLQYHCYPGGKKRVVTFSYDDGSPNDVRLVELFNQYGVKGTFHLNGEHLGSLSEEETLRLRTLYSGHEISCHTVRHGWMNKMPASSLIREIMDNRAHLEKIARYPVVGMSYPSGAWNEEAVNALRACGIVYSRTTVATKKMELPDDFLTWHPTCHHKDALALCDGFMSTLDSEWSRPLFYIWGHSHELRTEADWAYMEQLVSTLAGNDKIWYATNIEIYNYLTAVRSLIVSADESIVTNPTATDVWVEKNKKEIILIPAGKTIVLE